MPHTSVQARPYWVRRFCLSIELITLLLYSAPPALAQTGQTFVQLTDMGSNIGPRLTRTVSKQRINRDLFGRVGTKVTFIQGGLAYEFATDPVWSRALVGLKDDYINEYTNSSGPGGRILRPYGIDISARRNVYIADRERRRVLAATFDPAARNLVSPRNLALPGKRPIDVAWDGSNNPSVNDYLYVLDDSLSRVTYWNFNGGTPASPLWTYGSVGSGTGQFLRPTGICVSKTPGGSGTLFTTVFFVVDRGNKRVVRLFRSGTNSVTWSSTTTQPNWDPADCTVDHYGYLYVTDAQGHRIFKFGQFLDLIDKYGSFGTGPNSLNTFSSPGAISVPCGLKTVGSSTVWYCEGRLITAERWTNKTGAVEHWLGVKSQFTSQPPATEGTSVLATFKITDVAYLTTRIHRQFSGYVRNLSGPTLWSAGGGIGLHWDGKDNSGNPVPDGNYSFSVQVQSAYGCPTGALQPWCSTTVSSNYFNFHYCVPPGGGGGGNQPNALPGPPVCGSSIASEAGPMAGISPTFEVRQLPGRVDPVPMGLSRLASHQGIKPSMSVAGTAVSIELGRVSEVRRSGVMALQINLPTSTDIDVHIVDLQGRLIRREEISQTDAGVLVYRWNGRDGAGRRAPPGVYLVLVEADGKVKRTKLIVTGASE